MTYSVTINGGHADDEDAEIRALADLQKCVKDINASGAGANTTYYGFVDLLADNKFTELVADMDG